MAKVRFSVTGEAVVKLDCEEARECADLQSIDYDLALAEESLRHLEPFLRLPRDRSIDIVMGALWTFALVRYCRCFGSGIRLGLYATQVFEGFPEALEDHQHFKNERNKNTVHSVNPFEDFDVGIRLIESKGGTPEVSGTVFGQSLIVSGDALRLARLAELIAHVRAHVEEHISAATGQLLTRARSLTVGELLSLPAPELENAEVEAVNRSRSKRPET